MPYGAPGAYTMPPIPHQQYAPMSVPKNVIRVGEQALWSTQQYADAAALASTEQRLFVTPRGQTGQGFGVGLSLAETNLREGARIPGGYAYDVHGIAVQPYYSDQFPIVGGELRNIQNNLVLVWDFLQTRIEIAPVSLIGGGGGIFGSTADTGAAEGGTGGSRIALNSGAGQLWVYRLHPVALPANATYALLYSWGVAATVVDGGGNNSNLNLRTVLIGRYQTAIEIG